MQTLTYIDEKLFYSCPVFTTGLVKFSFDAFCIISCSLDWNFFRILVIDLARYYGKYYVSRSLLLKFIYPKLHPIEAFCGGGIIHNNNSCCVFVVNRGKRSKLFTTSSVPNLQLNLDWLCHSWRFNCFDFARIVTADCCFCL